ncbi:class A beta-lactamase [Streptomyces capitiformicae]|uniref:Beta-lactamase n=1 Tax=Streptomyces capitiformicae TaxID=2014920 RepID=A0A918Z036_9ACTN|nr:class A beta-lactamase [Streptomyces capitiformicae]GHE31358.1 beta-lactamase [Streptomyces capitiformicae]
MTALDIAGPNSPFPSRRALLTAGTAAVTGAALALASAAPAHATRDRRATAERLRELERQHGARIGAFAYNVATKATVTYRATDRFPLLSLFKTLAAAAILRDKDENGETLGKRIHYTTDDLVKANSPITQKPENLAGGLTVAELCDAAIRFSDNTAGNLLLRELGGPIAITAFCRSLGDRATCLDRWEPDVNTAEPWRVEDTTTPAAIARTYGRLVLGDALPPHDRDRLTAWLLANTTSGERFRKALPPDWTIADKTGGGDYGSNNDVGIAWTPDGTPVILAVLTTKPDRDAAPNHPLVAETARILAEAVVQGSR